MGLLPQPRAGPLLAGPCAGRGHHTAGEKRLGFPRRVAQLPHRGHPRSWLRSQPEPGLASWGVQRCHQRALCPRAPSHRGARVGAQCQPYWESSWGNELVRPGWPRAASEGKTTPGPANGDILSPTCPRPPCQRHRHGGEPAAPHAAKHGAQGPVSTPTFKNLQGRPCLLPCPDGTRPPSSPHPWAESRPRWPCWAGDHHPARHPSLRLSGGKHRSQRRSGTDQPSAKPPPRWQPCGAAARHTARQRARSDGPCQLVCSH